MEKVIFIISHKYIRGYESYLLYYIANIEKFYKDYLIIIVDNNSKYKDDIFKNIKISENIILLDNNISCKFEIGAYRVALKYIFDNNLFSYDYYVFTQDNFILKNKYNFNNLKNSCFINSYVQENIENIFIKDNIEKLDLIRYKDISYCWCSSFIILKNVLQDFYEKLSKINVGTSNESIDGEKILGLIIYNLNDKLNDKIISIDGDFKNLKYNSLDTNIYINHEHYFVKKHQRKTEYTNDIS